MKYVKAMGKIGFYSGALFGTYESIKTFSEGRVLEGMGLAAATGIGLLVEKAIFSGPKYSRRLWIDDPDPVDRYGTPIPMTRVNLFWKVPAKPPFYDKIPVHTSAEGTQSVGVFDVMMSDGECAEMLHDLEKKLAEKGVYLRDETSNKNSLTRL